VSAVEVAGPTARSMWEGIVGGPVEDELLEWPPDVFALANMTLARTEAFRFCLAPPGEWPPSQRGDWAMAVEDAGRHWSAHAQDGSALPELLLEEWRAVRERIDVPLERIATGEDRRLCEALTTVHAIADEACAGLGVALDSAHGDACAYRARGRELLARTGSIARLDTEVVQVLPKVCTPPSGRAAFCRYACVQAPDMRARWHKMPARHRGTDARSEYAKLLLLPWPLEVRESDFRVVEGSVQRLEREPFGFFEFAPRDGFDLDLLDRVLVSACAESGGVDVVVMPESALGEDEVEEVEALLDRHGVATLQAGVRGRPPGPGRFAKNWIHTSFNPRLEKGRRSSSQEPGDAWFHVRQRKHHRWSLDESQVAQYHLGGTLHPSIQWWEAMEVPRRVIEFVEVAELTLVSLVCQDLAENDDIASLLRSVGPTVVFAVLLDGPQLGGRWAARYASVLADDPGSAVLTLTSFGMVQRCRPHRREASRVIALWKDPATGVREIALEPGAHGVLVTVCMGRAPRRSADGRRPVDTGTYAYEAALVQISAAERGSTDSSAPREPREARHLLDGEDLTVLTAWAEAIAETLSYAPVRLDELIGDMRSGAGWRAAMSLPEPSEELDEALEAMAGIARGVVPVDGEGVFDALLVATGEEPTGEDRLHGLARRVLLSMLEQRRTRERPAP
jgi:hypothetical protein